jgi:hypothetical protein
MSKENQTDWERIEIDYRAGILTLREIAEQHKITHGAINKRAKRDGWERDLNAKIQARAAELVSKQLVSSEVSKEKLDTEKKVIEASANAIADVIRSHVTGIGKLQKVCDELTEELVTQSVSKEELYHVAELIALAQTQEGEAPDAADIQKRTNSFMKLLGLGNRAETFKKLVEAKTRLITLERTAFDLDKGAGKAQSIGEFLESC